MTADKDSDNYEEEFEESPRQKVIAKSGAVKSLNKSDKDDEDDGVKGQAKLQGLNEESPDYSEDEQHVGAADLA